MSDAKSIESAFPENLTESEERFVRQIVEKHKPCFGRGHRGWRAKTGAPIVCSCVWKAWGKIIAARAQAARKDQASEPV